MMRVHEFAKLSDLSSKDVLGMLKLGGFEVKSHMSVLSDEQVAYLEKKISKKEPSPKKPQAADTAKEKKIEKPSKAKKEDSSMSDKKTKKSKHKRSKEDGSSVQQQKENQSISSTSQVGDAQFIIRPISVAEFSEVSGMPVNDLIVFLLKQGKLYSRNHLLTEDEVKLLCQSFCVEYQERQKSGPAVLSGKVSLSSENQESRLPVVVIMGHVDHGKTTLLDFVRSSRVAAKEKGGITQHLGAYQVKTGHGNLVFLDTPGHEAFSKIRKRGASVADVAILVVAADDGIMPQTIESIKAIKALDIPVIVAINKIDRVPETHIERVKQQLAQHDLLPEDWGGEVPCVPISAKLGTGIDQLLDLVALQSELMELSASKKALAQGYVLESKTLKGRGPAATILLRQGVLNVGDFISAGAVGGKITALINSSGKNLESVEPSVPVLVTGFLDIPSVGDMVQTISAIEFKKLKASVHKKNGGMAISSSSDALNSFSIILKADTQSSLEAIVDSLGKLSKKDIKELRIIRSAVGNIRESDLLLAESTGAAILGFNVKMEHQASQVASKLDVSLSLFDIIYKLLEHVEEVAKKEEQIKMEWVKVGQATVLKVFKVKRLGVIAGCVVNEGKLAASGEIAVIRDRHEVYRAPIKSLQRDKKTVKEVNTGFECAFIIEGFDDWQEDDIAYCYVKQPVAKK